MDLLASAVAVVVVLHPASVVVLLASVVVVVVVLHQVLAVVLQVMEMQVAAALVDTDKDIILSPRF